MVGLYQFCFTFLEFSPARGVWGEVWEAWGRELMGLGRDYRIELERGLKQPFLGLFLAVFGT